MAILLGTCVLYIHLVPVAKGKATYAVWETNVLKNYKALSPAFAALLALSVYYNKGIPPTALSFVPLRFGCFEIESHSAAKASQQLTM